MPLATAEMLEKYFAEYGINALEVLPDLSYGTGLLRALCEPGPKRRAYPITDDMRQMLDDLGVTPCRYDEDRFYIETIPYEDTWARGLFVGDEPAVVDTSLYSLKVEIDWDATFRR